MQRSADRVTTMELSITQSFVVYGIPLCVVYTCLVSRDCLVTPPPHHLFDALFPKCSTEVCGIRYGTEPKLQFLVAKLSDWHVTSSHWLTRLSGEEQVERDVTPPLRNR